MASTYLSRTPASTGNRKIWTWSGWVKRSKLNYGTQQDLFTVSTSANTFTIFYFPTNTDTLVFYQATSGGTDSFYSTEIQYFRDVSAWYHIVLAVDTTQATASNRVKLYINGNSNPWLIGNPTHPTQNSDTYINTTNRFDIGSQGSGFANGTSCFDGLMASVYFIDGQALTPSSFGETDATTGIWKPKSYSGSYGTNGFFLKFESSGSLGTDSSGNGNNFTVNGTPTQTVDTPSNVFCTLNAIQNGNGTTSSLSNGNTTAGTNDNRGVAGTLGVNKGKWYWEVKNVGTQTNQRFGVSNRANEQDGDASPTGDTANVRSYVGLNYQKNYSASSGTTNNSFIGTNGTVFAFALDLDNGTMGRYVNGTLISTDTTLPSDNSVTFFPFTFVTFNNGNWNQAQFNFGNGVFGSTAISSPYSDGAGLGKFQYAVPSGYYALCTKNINVYG